MEIKQHGETFIEGAGSLEDNPFALPQEHQTNRLYSMWVAFWSSR